MSEDNEFLDKAIRHPELLKPDGALRLFDCVQRLRSSIAHAELEASKARTWAGVCEGLKKDADAREFALREELERVKQELEMSFRVVDSHKKQAQESTRIGCENITRAESTERDLAKCREALRLAENRACPEKDCPKRKGWRVA